jgi:hypothetical protein
LLCCKNTVPLVATFDFCLVIIDTF